MRLIMSFSVLLFIVSLSFPGAAVSADYTNSIGMEFIKLNNGCFQMGRDPAVEEGSEDELPRHRVCITKPLYIGKTEVTQDQWMEVMGYNPSEFKGGDRPVERVSWRKIQEFTTNLNEKEWGARYRLPTEAEWEYAARAGTDTTFFFGNDPKQLFEYAWFGNEQAGEQTHPVAGKRANPWGLYDMYGNVWELVRDSYDARYYANSPMEDPAGATSGRNKVARGGGWRHAAVHCRSAERDRVHERLLDSDLGFRLVLEILADPE